MRDPVRNLLRRIADEVLLDLDELKYLAYNRVFWAGTFVVLAIGLLDGCMRRGV